MRLTKQTFVTRVASTPGLILIPKQVVDRLTNDDQLAAVIADGVAYNLELQSTRLITENLEILGAEVAGEIALSEHPRGCDGGGRWRGDC